MIAPAHRVDRPCDLQPPYPRMVAGRTAVRVAVALGLPDGRAGKVTASRNGLRERASPATVGQSPKAPRRQECPRSSAPCIAAEFAVSEVGEQDDHARHDGRNSELAKERDMAIKRMRHAILQDSSVCYYLVYADALSNSDYDIVRNLNDKNQHKHIQLDSLMMNWDREPVPKLGKVLWLLDKIL